jgi:ribosomal protein L24
MSAVTKNRAGSGVRPARIATRLKKGDTVLVISGKERGKTGKILRVIGEKNRATVERMNMVKRHRKGRSVARRCHRCGEVTER